MTTMNMTVRLGPRNIALDIGPNGDAYDDDRFLAFGLDTSVFIDKPYPDYRENDEAPWVATYQVGGISPQPQAVMQDRVDAMAKAMQVGESVVAWLNVTGVKGIEGNEYGYQFDPKHVYDYLTGDGFKAMAGIARAK